MKTLNKFISESNHKFYPEDWNDLKNEKDLVEAILEALSFSGIYNSICESIENELDPHIFEDDKFLKEFGKQFSDKVNEYYEDNY
jgi:hypothetical protein